MNPKELFLKKISRTLPVVKLHAHILSQILRQSI